MDRLSGEGSQAPPGFEARDRHQEKEYKNMDRYEIEGYEVIEMVVRSGNQYSARANLPLAWQGLRIKVVRLDPLPELVEE